MPLMLLFERAAADVCDSTFIIVVWRSMALRDFSSISFGTLGTIIC